MTKRQLKAKARRKAVVRRLRQQRQAERAEAKIKWLAAQAS
tara:strand:- start:477 stop:599 length:123 start_codon:yes stop_codon:yes gene_type:complete